MNIKPLGNRLLVREIESRYTLPEGTKLVVPETIKDSLAGPKVWRVIDVGPKVKEVPKGARVLAHSPHEGPLQLPGEYWTITEDQVLAIV